jgi:hypothetical protein
MNKWILSCLLLSNQALALTPAECGGLGVLIDPNNLNRGTVIAIANDVFECQYMTHGDLTTGCMRWLGLHRSVNQWKISYINDCARRHTTCHAEYMTFAHTSEFNSLKPGLEACISN